MKIIRGRNNNRIGKFWTLKNPFPSVEAFGFRNVVSFCIPLIADRDRFGDTDNFQMLRVLNAVVAINIAATAGAQGNGCYRRRYIQLGGPGWKPVLAEAARNNYKVQPDTEAINVPTGILHMVIGCAAVYSALFGTGFVLYGQWYAGLPMLAIAATGIGWILRKHWLIAEEI